MQSELQRDRARRGTCRRDESFRNCTFYRNKKIFKIIFNRSFSQLDNISHRLFADHDGGAPTRERGGRDRGGIAEEVGERGWSLLDGIQKWERGVCI